MKRIFADTSYWVALLNPADQLYQRARALDRRLIRARLFTTDLVLAEFLNFYASRGRMLRAAAGLLVSRILRDPQIQVVASDRELFEAGLGLYSKRPDQQYSLTDCVSMVVMRRRGIAEALTQDHHFRREGFVTLLEGE